tara:strand:+ start:2777 stop:3772 length:996 start_codon:yes stop_codon:yes gene_type:complete
MSGVKPYTIQRLRGGFAIVWYEGDKRHRRQLDSDKRVNAEAEARRLWEAADETPWTIGRILEGYISHLAKSDPPSLQRRKDAWKAMRSFWGNVEIGMIDDEMCIDYRASRRVADSTVRYELLLLSTALNWAKKKAHILDRPSIWLPEKDAYRIRYLEREDFEKFYEAVKSPHARLYVLLGVYTIARPSAILELEWSRVDFERRQIDLNPVGRRQTAKRRPIVPINSELHEALAEAFEARQSDFVIERGGEPIRSIKKAFQAASKRSGIKATPYTLRHTGAVWAAEAGIPMAALAQLMGHDDDRTTQKHYARFSPSYLKDVGDKIAEGRRRR